MKKTLFILFILVSNQLFAQPSVQWVRQLTAGVNKDVTQAGVATDGLGNTYIACTYNGTVDFGGTTLTYTGTKNCYVAKYNSVGALQWVKQVVDAATPSLNFSITPIKIRVDGSGNIILVGKFNGTASISGASYTSIGFSDNFILKYNNAGVLQWFVTSGYSPFQAHTPNSVITDAANNIYVVGNFSGNMNCSGTILTAIGSTDTFFIKYNSAGVQQWVKQIGAVGKYTGSYSIATDGSNNIFVTGNFYGTTDFGGTSLTASAGATGYDFDLFIAKYSTSDATLQWVKKTTNGSPTQSQGKYFSEIAADVSGNVFVTGTFAQTIDFGGISLSAIGTLAVFTAFYDNLGTLQWVKQAGAPDFLHNQASEGLAIDASNNVYITYGMFGNVNFDGTIINPINGAGDLLIAKYNSAGVIQWIRHAGAASGSNQTEGRNIALDNSGTIYVVGGFQGSVNFFGTTLTSPNSGNFYFDEFILVLQQDIFQTIATGNWNANGTWNTNTTPTATNTVRINSTHTVSIPNTDNEVKAIQMNGGIINLNGGTLEIKNQ